MDKKELFIMLGFIKSSKRRLMVLRAIENSIKTPTEIGKEIGDRTIQTSNALNALKEKKLVYCLNEDATKGRLYTTTQFGKEIMKEYDRYVNSNELTDQELNALEAKFLQGNDKK